MADQSDDETQGLLGPETYNNIREQWNTFLDRPGGRAALLQAGLTLMNYPGSTWGGNAMTPFAQAIGSAGEAVGRQEKMDIAQQEAASKEQLRGAQAEAAGARATTAGMGLSLQQQKIEQAKTLAQLQAGYRLRGMHSTEVGRLKALNQKIAGDVMLKPEERQKQMHSIPTFEEWLQSDPQARALAERSGYSLGSGAPATLAPPQVGETRNGYTFKGGDPGDPNNWTPPGQ